MMMVSLFVKIRRLGLMMTDEGSMTK